MAKIENGSLKLSVHRHTQNTAIVTVNLRESDFQDPVAEAVVFRLTPDECEKILNIMESAYSRAIADLVEQATT